MDRHQQGRVSETDLWQFPQSMGSTLTFNAVCALVRDVQRSRRDFTAVQGALGLREFSLLILPKRSAEYKLMSEASSDREGTSLLLAFRRSGQSSPIVDWQDKYHFYRLIETAAKAADESEHLRERLAVWAMDSFTMLMADVYVHIAGGKSFMTLSDLRAAFMRSDVHVTERELELIWARYSQVGADVLLSDFTQHLRPRTSMWI